MMRRLGALLAAAVVLVPALAWAGRVFQYKDDKGQTVVTDSLWDLPPGPRQRYLDLIEDEARRKLTPERIKELKEAGNWPPMEFIRPPSVKEAMSKGDLGFTMLGSDAEVLHGIQDEFRFQWESFYAEQKAAQEMLKQARALIPLAEEAVERAATEDMVNGRLGPNAQAPQARKELEVVRLAVAAAEARVAALPARQLALMQGQRAFQHAGEDGGPATFGLPR